VSEPITVCNKENGSFSELWGRDCWVADSVLKLVICEADRLFEQSNDPEVDRTLKGIMAYCDELREKNRVYFADTIEAPE
jgi:hypothetical protein